MTLDCPFRNPLQSRVISVHSCYLTSFWLPLFLQNCHIPHHIRSAFFGTHLFNVFFVTALAVLSSNVRSWLLKGLRIACSGFVVRAYPGAELLGRISDRMWRWVSFPGSGFLAGFFFLSSGQGSCFGAAPYFRSSGIYHCWGFTFGYFLF